MRAISLAILASIAAFGASQQTAKLPAATEDGLTVWVYALEGNAPAQMPTLVEGQTPNYYAIHRELNLQDGVNSQEGDIKTNFVGKAFGYFIAPKDATYTFRLVADDFADLSIGGIKVTQAGVDGSSSESSIKLKAGVYPINVNFFQKGGKFYVRLEQKQEDGKWGLVPSSQLKSEAGQTFVVAPGQKKWFLGKDTNRPGDGRPLTGVHPSFKLETFRPDPFHPAVGGMAFLPDGRLAICTWDQVGAVYILSNLKGGPGKIKVTEFASGLGEPLGITYYQGDLYVTQKREITRLRDLNKDGICDSYEAIAEGWPMSHNYHEFTFNLVPKNGKFYISTSVPLRGGWTYYNPGSHNAFPLPGAAGTILEIDPKTGKWTRYAEGLRTPNGMGIGPEGELFVSDNQGSWLPSSRINQVIKGAHYGHQESPDGKKASVPPAVWVPHNEIGNSPSEPVLVPSGVYKGQMVYGDVTHGGIKRLFLEKVGGRYQGAIFRFTQGLEAGVNRLVWGPDGALYVGGIGSNGNWNHMNKRFGLQRLVPNKQSTFEMLKVEARKTGFKVTFTEPVKNGKLLEFRRWRYNITENYGGPKVDQMVIPFTEKWSADRRSVEIVASDFKPGYVYYFRFNCVNKADKPLWSTESWYTLNAIP